MSWVAVGDKLRCKIHDPDGIRAFGKLEQCAQCMRASGPVVPRIETTTDEAAATAPDGCLSAVERERSLTQIAIYTEEIARSLSEPGADRDIPSAVRMFDVAIKAHRAAGEYTVVRERRNYVARLERTVARLRGGRN